MADDKIISVGKAAEYLGVSSREVYNKIKSGKIFAKKYKSQGRKTNIYEIPAKGFDQTMTILKNDLQKEWNHLDAHQILLRNWINE